MEQTTKSKPVVVPDERVASLLKTVDSLTTEVNDLKKLLLTLQGFTMQLSEKITQLSTPLVTATASVPEKKTPEISALEAEPVLADTVPIEAISITLEETKEDDSAIQSEDIKKTVEAEITTKSAGKAGKKKEMNVHSVAI